MTIGGKGGGDISGYVAIALVLFLGICTMWTMDLAAKGVVFADASLAEKVSLLGVFSAKVVAMLLVVAGFFGTLGLVANLALKKLLKIS
jgi:hypothetical protein